MESCTIRRNFSESCSCNKILVSPPFIMSAARGGSAAAGRAGSRRGAVPTAVAPDAAAAADALDAEDEAMDDAAAATAPWKAELDSILYGSSCLP